MASTPAVFFTSSLQKTEFASPSFVSVKHRNPLQFKNTRSKRNVTALKGKKKLMHAYLLKLIMT